MGAGVKSAERTLDVLQLLASSLRPVPTMAIARACGIPKSSTHHLLNVLRTRGWVTYYEADRGWGLGAVAFETGSAYLRSQPLERLGHPIVRDVARATDLPAQLAVLRGEDVLYLEHEAAPDAQVRQIAAAGVRLPAHLTAVGQAMLAWLSPTQVRALYVRPLLDRRTEEGPRTVSRLLEQLDAVRLRGYAIELGLVTPGQGCIAASALSHEGYPIAAIGVTFAAGQQDERALATAVVDAARRLSAGMGVRKRRLTDQTQVV